jgi:GT2 family glycosyltransferase
MRDLSQATVAVVILNWNGWRDTLACVRSVLAHAPDSQVVVCDNGSSDGSYEHLESTLSSELPAGALCCLQAMDTWPQSVEARVVLIQNGANLGFAGGCNVGLRFALAQKHGYFWLLNNDTEIEPGALDGLLQRMARDPQVGMCGSRLVYFDTPDIVQARGGATYDPTTGVGQHLGVHESISAPENPEVIEASMDYVVGASMLVSRRFLELVGLMREDYFLYFEELDWATRGRARGFRLAYAPQSVVRHKEGASIGSSHHGPGSMLSMRYLSRNRLLYTQRFHPQHLGSVRRRMLFEAVVYAKRLQWPAAKVVLLSLFMKRQG